MFFQNAGCRRADSNGHRPPLQGRQNPVELLRVDIQSAIRPNNKIGARDFLVNRPLRGDALFDLLRRPAAGEQALPLILRRTRNANDFVEVRFSLGFKKQRNDNDSQRAIFPAPAVASRWRGTPGFTLGEPAFADARVQNGFEFFAGGGIGEDDLRQHEDKAGDGEGADWVGCADGARRPGTRPRYGERRRRPANMPNWRYT